jgi:hypothetical protein
MMMMQNVIHFFKPGFGNPILIREDKRYASDV